MRFAVCLLKQQKGRPFLNEILFFFSQFNKVFDGRSSGGLQTRAFSRETKQHSKKSFADKHCVSKLWEEVARHDHCHLHLRIESGWVMSGWRPDSEWHTRPRHTSVTPLLRVGSWQPPRSVPAGGVILQQSWISSRWAATNYCCQNFNIEFKIRRTRRSLAFPSFLVIDILSPKTFHPILVV